MKDNLGSKHSCNWTSVDKNIICDMFIGLTVTDCYYFDLISQPPISDLLFNRHKYDLVFLVKFEMSSSIIEKSNKPV